MKSLSKMIIMSREEWGKREAWKSEKGTGEVVREQRFYLHHRFRSVKLE